ncbi:MAG: GldG family protein [Leptospiraceae bacterium]|nr:GldG family protein [Leptospiraceae bacterium]
MISFFQKFNQSRKFLSISFIILFFLFNLTISDWNCRKDLSKENRFNLTESTSKIINSLSDKLFIDAFYSSDVPGTHKARLQMAKEILKEIAGVNRSKVELRFYDPDGSETAKKKASEAGIKPYTLEKQERGSAEVKQAYFGVRITLGTKTETIPVAYAAESVEYQVLSILKKLTRKSNTSSLAIAKVNGAFTAPELNQMSSPNKDTFSVLIHRAYSPENGEPGIVNINIEPVGEEFTSLLVVGTPELSDLGRYNIDQFLMRGGNLILFIKTMDFQLPDPRQQQFMGMMGNNQQGIAQASPEASKLKEWTSKYGFEVRSEFILEPESSMATDSLVQLENGMLTRYHYPLWPIATKEGGGVNETNVLSKTLSGILLPWASGIDVKPEVQLGAKFETIFQSTRDADRRADFAVIGEEQVANQKINSLGTRIPLAIHIEGKMKSSFTKDSIPKDTKPELFLSETKEGKKSQIFVSGSPYLLSDVLVKNQYLDFLQKTNIPFILNLFDIFSGDTDMISTRTKQAYVQNLRPVKKLEQYIFTFMNILLFPIGIGIFAFIRLKKRNSGKGF